MKQRIIIDTSIWVEYFKNKAGIVEFIDNGLDNGCIYITGPIISELLQGVKSDKELNMLSKCIDADPGFKIDTKDWIDAGVMSYSLRKKGYAIPLTDILIAVIAKNNDAAVYTLDKHFSYIPGLELIK
ncbi:MAG: PIN domain-containing protein [Clostridiaceae bacterium]|nr:PIN domain-containing protein [Clostridiaceae bacterium]